MSGKDSGMDKTNFLWEGTHPDYDPVRVEAPDRLHAVAEAARAWGVPAWTSVARTCEVRKIGPAPAQKTPPAQRPAEKPKKCRQRQKQEGGNHA